MRTDDETMAANELIGGRYEVLGLLGAGGMGAVYKARDVELDEVVALKMLRREFCGSAEMLERFKREVKLARRVTHTNVARTFDIGEHAGDRFLTMEYVEGEPLESVLARQYVLAASKCVELAVGVCAGLGAAHAAGVVHRDLKPANVMLERTTGRIVITDFGVARSHVADSDVNKTFGGVVGTPAYMAPEQVEGAPDVDARADIYALGVMLFEMLTGELPWPGQTPFAVAAARLHGTPPDPRTVRADVPPALADITLRCMARRREDRWSSVEELQGALSAVALTQAAAASLALTPPARPRINPAQPTAVGDKTVAVLPLRNGGPEADDYIADGLTEDVIDTLSVTPGLKVRPRGVVMSLPRESADPLALGAQLGVQVVVEGSVRRANDAVRIAVRVLSVADGFQLWAKRFERSTADLLVVSDEVARAIAEALSVELDAPGRQAPSDPLAIDLYLRARQEFHRRYPDALRRAIELFREAEARAPGDPTILAGYARTAARLWFLVPDPTSGLARMAQEISARALQAAPDRGEPLLARASVCYTGGDLLDAARHVRDALDKAPMLADAHALYAELVSEVGSLDDSLTHFGTALSLDPALRIDAHLARAYALLGQWQEVDVIYSKPEEDPAARVMLAVSSARFALWSPEPVAALERVPNIDALPPLESVRYARLVIDVIRSGQLDPSGRDLLHAGLSTKGRAPRLITLVCQLGAELMSYVLEVDEALDFLEHGVESGLIDLNWMDRCPLLGPLRTHERFHRARTEIAARAAQLRGLLGVAEPPHEQNSAKLSKAKLSH